MFFLSILAIFFTARTIMPRTNAGLTPVDHLPQDILPAVSKHEAIAEMEIKDEHTPKVLETATEMTPPILPDDDEVETLLQMDE